MFGKKKKRVEISAPSNFEHRVHTGFDQHEQKFTGLPRQWQSLIEESARRPKPLIDPACITSIQPGAPKVAISTSFYPQPGAARVAQPSAAHGFCSPGPAFCPPVPSGKMMLTPDLHSCLSTTHSTLISQSLASGGRQLTPQTASGLRLGMPRLHSKGWEQLRQMGAVAPTGHRAMRSCHPEQSGSVGVRPELCIPPRHTATVCS